MARPTTTASLVLAGIFLLIHLVDGDAPTADRAVGIMAGSAAILYLLGLYFVVLPRSLTTPILEFGTAGVTGILVGLLYTIRPGEPILFQDLLILLVVIFIAGVSGRWPTYVFIGVVSLFRLYFARAVFFSVTADVYQWIGTLLIGIVLTETIQALRQIIERHITRMDILNNVARNLASSLETHQVVSLLSAVVQKSFQADTYYVGFLRDNKIRLELFYDDGEFFPSQDVPLEGNLASWVIRNKKSLLIYDLSRDAKQMGIPWVVIGKQKVSVSWMGTPIELAGKMLGVVAVASYQRSAFDQADLNLLESVAQQAALAIDNSYHHAEVEHQSHLDSLTGVYNHGYFLKRLAHEAENALQDNYTLSLIMLDIDHFKQYNDTYGHLVGDQVLSLLVRNIRDHIKNTDLVGRWGGEEFVIILRQANGPQASMVAERIRQSMNSFLMTEREPKRIPSPTVSQGVALFPGETADIFKLIDLADQRLYVAKDRGRNQIEPQEGYWSTPAENMTETTA